MNSKNNQRLGKNAAIFAAAAMTGVVATAGAQSAAVELSASATSVQPGDTVTVELRLDYSTGASPSGVFGDAGLFGFGGEVSLSGDLDATADSAILNPALTSGQTSMSAAAPALVRAAAGRLLMDGGLVQNPSILLSFDLTIDPAAIEGTLTLGYDGAVVLALGDELTTYATSPGANQSMLSVTTVDITIGSACVADVTTDGANPGDPGFLVPDGSVSVGDLTTFVEQWVLGDASIADITTDGANPGDPGFLVPDGSVSVGDLTAFVEQWVVGCP